MKLVDVYVLLEDDFWVSSQLQTHELVDVAGVEEMLFGKNGILVVLFEFGLLVDLLSHC